MYKIERQIKESIKLFNKRIPHYEKGHLNLFVKDQDSCVTGFGVHARVLVFSGKGVNFCRVDMVHGLRKPTQNEILTVLAIKEGLVSKKAIDNFTRKRKISFSFSSVEKEFESIFYDIELVEK